jgi:acetoin utilization protein AcuB
MSSEVITASPRTTVAEALEILRVQGIRHLPVVDAGRLAGIVTDRDLREAAADGDMAIDALMTSPPLMVAPDVPVESAAALLSEHRIGCLPVVEGEELVGILTESDVLRAFVELMVGREPHSRVEILAPDRPGELARVVRLIGIDHGINITGVVVPPSHGGQALVVLHLETDEPEPVLEHLRRLGYESGSPALLTRPV